jgi:hypothetical protein
MILHTKQARTWHDMTLHDITCHYMSLWPWMSHDSTIIWIMNSYSFRLVEKFQIGHMSRFSRNKWCSLLYGVQLDSQWWRPLRMDANSTWAIIWTKCWCHYLNGEMSMEVELSKVDSSCWSRATSWSQDITTIPGQERDENGDSLIIFAGSDSFWLLSVHAFEKSAERRVIQNVDFESSFSRMNDEARVIYWNQWWLYWMT